jgi:hypothetical protein
MNIKEKLEKKFDYLQEYRKVTQELYDDIHNAEKYLDKRDEIAEKIQEINIQLIADKESDKTLEKVLSFEVERENLSEEFQEYFDIYLNIKSTVNRIDEMDEIIREKMQAALDDLTVKIKEENTGSNAGYAKYANAFGLQSKGYSRTKTV